MPNHVHGIVILDSGPVDHVGAGLKPEILLTVGTGLKPASTADL